MISDTDSRTAASARENSFRIRWPSQCISAQAQLSDLHPYDNLQNYTPHEWGRKKLEQKFQKILLLFSPAIVPYREP